MGSKKMEHTSLLVTNQQYNRIPNSIKKYRRIAFMGVKRFFDILCSIIGLVLLAPLMLIIAIAIKMDSSGPILFKQKRTGKGGIVFTMYKFRTMEENNDVYDQKKEDKHTRIGRILRKTSLDELPQLFSIMSGKMSFIGPRPWIPDYYNNMNETQKDRCLVRPGLTGLAQVMGRNSISIFKKIEYDLEYINNLSLHQDIKIIVLTIKAVFSGKGADAGKGTVHKEIKDLARQNKE